MIIEKAYAKINLFLNVTDCRDDGYHDIESVMHAVDLHDIISMDTKDSDKPEIILSSNSPLLSSSSSNLAYIAAEKYLSKYGINAQININLEKRIPIGAGLGGGSSDAAATLRALNKIYNAAKPGELLEIALSIGSDVPFCLLGGTAHCLGRGEIMTAKAVKKKMHFVIAIGNERTSTPEAYRRLDSLYSESGFPEKSELCEKMCSALGVSDDISSCVYNIFESVTDISDVKKIKEEMMKNGAKSALMSGSGPSVFGIFKSIEDSQLALKSLLSKGYTAFACESVCD